MGIYMIECMLYKEMCIYGTIIFAILMGLISLFHTITAHKHIDRKSTSLNLSFILLLVGIFASISLCIEIFEPSFETGLWFCTIMQHVNPSIYILFKLLLNMILILRLTESYGDSALAYNTKKLNIWAGIIITWSAGNLIYVNLTVTSAIDNHMFPRCHTMITYPALISMASLDVIAGIINLILFITPLIMLSSLIKDDSVSTHSLKNLTKKQCILSIIAVLSTIFALVGMLLIDSQQIFIPFDMVVSLIAIILLYQWNSTITNGLFCCCLQSDSSKNGKAKVHMSNMQKAVDESVHTKSSTTSNGSTLDRSRARAGTVPSVTASSFQTEIVIR